MNPFLSHIQRSKTRSKNVLSFGLQVEDFTSMRHLATAVLAGTRNFGGNCACSAFDRFEHFVVTLQICRFA